MKDFVLNAYLILTTWRMSKMSATSRLAPAGAAGEAGIGEGEGR
jgi:hypothetical protein